MYYLQERKTISDYKNKREAIQDKENNELWYPENNYYVVDEEGKKVKDEEEK